MIGKRFLDVQLKADERIDDLERNGYGIIQKKDGFCFGMDAVLLSGFINVLPGEKVLDLGTGTGIIPILLEAKTKGKFYRPGNPGRDSGYGQAKRKVKWPGGEDQYCNRRY